MSGKKSPYPDGRIPDRLPDGRPAVPWKSRWTEGVLPLWLVATAGGMAVLFVVGVPKKILKFLKIMIFLTLK